VHGAHGLTVEGERRVERIEHRHDDRVSTGDGDVARAAEEIPGDARAKGFRVIEVLERRVVAAEEAVHLGAHTRVILDRRYRLVRCVAACARGVDGGGNDQAGDIQLRLGHGAVTDLVGSNRSVLDLVGSDGAILDLLCADAVSRQTECGIAGAPSATTSAMTETTSAGLSEP